MDNRDLDSLENVKVDLHLLDKDTVISPALQSIVNTVQALNASVVSAIQSDAMRSIINIGNKISNMISKVDFTPMLKKFSEAMIPIYYIDLLTKLKWPIFLIQNEELRQQIFDACKENENVEEVKKIIFEYCSDDFIQSLQEDWCACDIIKEERKSILNEALLMHCKGHYYASTSVLMCQIYGIASDIIDLTRSKGLTLDYEGKEFVSEYFEIKIEDIDKEKGKLLQTIVMTESGQLLWNAMATYLKTEILSSSDSKKRWETQPLRNKICHGEQLNFGNKEHSLKAILTIDMLIQLGYEIKRVSKNNEKSNECDVNEDWRFSK